MKNGGKIGMEVIMRGRHKEVKHTRMCVTKSKKIGSPKINIENGWKEFKTTNVESHGFVNSIVTGLGYVIKVS
jgi:hypothetical protein